MFESELPGTGSLSAADLRAISQESCSVLSSMGPQIQRVESFVTEDRITCIHFAPDEAQVREHVQRGGFPATSVSRVKRVIDPTTAE